MTVSVPLSVIDTLTHEKVCVTPVKRVPYPDDISPVCENLPYRQPTDPMSAQYLTYCSKSILKKIDKTKLSVIKYDQTPTVLLCVDIAERHPLTEKQINEIQKAVQTWLRAREKNGIYIYTTDSVNNRSAELKWGI